MTMYAYRQASARERAEMLAARREERRPWHAPPHFEAGSNVYLLTAACYEHKPLMLISSRRAELVLALSELMEAIHGDLRAWTILPNHYHLVAEVDLSAFAARVGRLHNGKSTQWNREDDTPGRKVWHRFADRRIRGERHYFAALNYVHANAVHHGLATTAEEWTSSSHGVYLREIGNETLERWANEYPIDHFGEGWDEM